ncbi:MAG: Sec-independent protein translocase subunit TatA/TatB [Desulfosporosinus sp.]|jgi:sec-independent protein translocase protein TatA
MGMSEILLILIVVLLLFGPEDLPKIARAIGKGIFEIRKATDQLSREFQKTAMDSNPVNIINKAFEQTTSPPNPATKNEQSEADDRKTDEEVSTKKDENSDTEKLSKTKSEAPLD